MAKRWSAVFLILPLLAFLAGECFEWVRYRRDNEARCIAPSKICVPGPPRVGGHLAAFILAALPAREPKGFPQDGNCTVISSHEDASHEARHDTP